MSERVGESWTGLAENVMVVGASRREEDVVRLSKA